MEKDFTEWHCVKTILQMTDTDVFFRERDIWLCSLGMNLGHEEDGKQSRFLRPVVVFRKFNQDLFWGIPLTSTLRTGSYYYQFEFKGRISTALLSQARLFDRKRLARKMGHVSNEEFQALRGRFVDLLR
jgi:mRNA interferase MazF